MPTLTLLLAACAGAPEAPQVEATAPPTAPTATWTPPPIRRCDSVALLTQYSFEDLAGGTYCKVCKAEDEMACEMDWPTNDVPSCALWDELRNGIYAYYGRPFETDRWKQHFAKLSWYRADPSFTDDRLSAVARANVALLKQRAEGKVGCMD